ncbi:MAG: hypothetical protein ACKVOK_03200 [Flavobacteriales bacterium]
MFNQLKYRRLSSIIGVALCVVISGYWLFAGAFQCWQLYKVKTEIHQYIKTHAPDSLLVSFTTSQLRQPAVRFIHAREFELNSFKYDIVDSLETAEGLIIRCVCDDREKKVEEQLLNLYGHQNETHKKSGNNVPEMIKYVTLQDSTPIHAIESGPMYGSVYLARDYQHSNYLESPPPEEFDGFLNLS